MGTLLCFVCITVVSFAVVAQPAVAQGTNTFTYPAQVFQGGGSQTCPYEGQRKRVRNGVGSAMLSLLRESVVPFLQNFSCGGSTGWRRVAYLDMADPSQQCPPMWREITTPHRVCGRMPTGVRGCDGVTYFTRSQQYDQMCGRIIGYQLGNTDSFLDSSRSIDTYYVDGVSVTHGNPRQHIWTFASGLDELSSISYAICPCVTGSTNGNRIPSFVGQNYFCESGLTRWKVNSRSVLWPDGDPLWDGQGCGPTSSCCTFNSPPWFNVQLPSPTTDNIEVRICSRGSVQTPIQLMELYVK